MLRPEHPLPAISPPASATWPSPRPATKACTSGVGLRCRPAVNSALVSRASAAKRNESWDTSGFAAQFLSTNNTASFVPAARLRARVLLLSVPFTLVRGERSAERRRFHVVALVT